jgi:alkyl sulfatase BDS1-like metallo-beta-lactamase superfamily hydrolase
MWMNILTLAMALVVLSACSETEPTATTDTMEHVDLAALVSEFKQEVIKVTDGVHVAVGFGLANSILLEGDDGVIIVDTMESVEAAIPIKKAFDKISPKPVKAIIYTHNHADHIFGGKVFAGNDHPDVYSHESTVYYIDRIAGILRPIIYTRSMRQFGTFLPEGGLLNAGIGPHLVLDNTTTRTLVRPNKTFSGERLTLKIAGIELELVHAPGETNDQIFVWLPKKKVLLSADNFYKSFPNLYAIRGTTYRDVIQWVKSLDKMRALKPEYLVPSHTRPLVGSEEIYETLTNYRDAIQFVHDQTVRHMNQGHTPGEIVERVKLPPHLARLPYLQEYYGTVAWSVRGIFDGYLGWFDGNATHLFPLPLRERAERLARLAGGEDALLEQAREAIAQDDHQWALELTDQLLLLKPELKEARKLKAKALTSLGGQQTAFTARHYYLTQALELEDKVQIGQTPVRDKDKDVLHSIPLQAIFSAMAVNLNPVKSAHVDKTVGFRFPDTGEAFTVHVRRGVAEIQPRFPENPDISVTVDSNVWKEVVAGLRNPVVALFKDIEKEGGMLNLMKFLGLFKRS